ncbi:Os04g0256250 [Oryza sativa Japonica Group]|uniref:Os04g0256250 protein n=1 Tax=Oryza sativa subsp. japonica TaxID=39947 RepID=A0A0P0W7Z0_ORYSJ|nr:Os04g0256250 [Oryza sativa Japonica Group]
MATPLLEFLRGIDKPPSKLELLHAGSTSHHHELGPLETPTTTWNSVWMGRRVEEDERAGQREVEASSLRPRACRRAHRSVVHATILAAASGPCPRARAS